MKNLVIFALAAAFLRGFALSTNEALMRRSMTSLKAMEKVFLRSHKTHYASMVSISRSLTSPQKAFAVLQKRNITSPALAQVAQMVVRRKSSFLKRQPAGYSGISGARKLLNDMIYESASKYDQEIAKCTEFYSRQCAMMTVARGEISAANYLAASSRAHILSSQGTISRCEEDIPTRKLQLKQFNLGCKHELKKMNDRLAILLADIAVMTTILKMTACKPKSLFLQEDLGMMKCKSGCGKTEFVQFKHEGLSKQIGHLRSVVSQKMLHDVMADLFDGVQGLEAAEFHQFPAINKTQFNNPPVPRTAVPPDPCEDEHGGAPSPETKRAAKCTITRSPQCYKLQERFLLIQSGITDERDDLLEEIARTEAYCQDAKDTLETTIANDESMLGTAQTNLAAATEDEADAGEKARQTAKEHDGFHNELKRTMSTCNKNYINYETELCALKKIRGELYKMQGGGIASTFFQDCEVSTWEPESCSKECGGGEQKIIRSVMTHPNGGAKCLPLAAMKTCNLNPCPVDCRLSSWNGWSKCSAQCGGGVQQRLRDVKVAMKYGGKPCGETSETVACNIEACEKDCTLSEWTKWSSCSKDCDGGTKKRVKYVKDAAEGDGKCADKWSVKRLEYKQCNNQRCATKDPLKPIECSSKLDVVLLLDGSGSLGKKGWDAEKAAARSILGALTGDVEVAVILFSGPSSWAGVEACSGRGTQKVDLEKTCKIKTVTHFTDNPKKARALIDDMTWPEGGTLTSLALLAAKAELSLGRKDAQSIVVVLTDGRPMSYRKTTLAATALRKVTRLMWVPVTKYAPLKEIKKWATRRWEENVVPVDSFENLKKAEIITHLMADLCPHGGIPRVGTLPYTCPTTDSSKCTDVYKKAVEEKNVFGFCDMCRTETGSDPLRDECTKCCTACAPFVR